MRSLLHQDIFNPYILVTLGLAAAGVVVVAALSTLPPADRFETLASRVHWSRKSIMRAVLLAVEFVQLLPLAMPHRLAHGRVAEADSENSAMRALHIPRVFVLLQSAFTPQVIFVLVLAGFFLVMLAIALLHVLSRDGRALDGHRERVDAAGAFLGNLLFLPVIVQLVTGAFCFPGADMTRDTASCAAYSLPSAALLLLVYPSISAFVASFASSPPPSASTINTPLLGDTPAVTPDAAEIQFSRVSVVRQKQVMALWSMASIAWLAASSAMDATTYFAIAGSIAVLGASTLALTTLYGRTCSVRSVTPARVLLYLAVCVVGIASGTRAGASAGSHVPIVVIAVGWALLCFAFALLSWRGRS